MTERSFRDRAHIDMDRARAVRIKFLLTKWFTSEGMKISAKIVLAASSCLVFVATTYKALDYRHLAIVAQQKYEGEKKRRQELDALLVAAGSTLLLELTKRDAITEGITKALQESEALQKQFVLRDAGYPNGDDASISRAIRDYVYRAAYVGPGSDHGASYGRYYADVGNVSHPMLCGGMSAAYVWALSQVGIPARIVQLASQEFLDGVDSGATHVTVETFTGGAWHISDPTFNVEVGCGADQTPLDVQSAAQCVADGGALMPIVDSAGSQIVGRRLSDYFMPYKDLFAGYSAPVYDDGRISTPALSYSDEQ
jgi:hypothetical protein